MFIPLRKRNQESGVILLIMIGFVVVILIISAAILSQSLNQTNLEQLQIEQIQQAQVAKGIFWEAYANGMSAGTTNFSLGNHWYNGTVSNGASGAGPNNSTQYNVVVTYN